MVSSYPVLLVVREEWVTDSVICKANERLIAYWLASGRLEG